jgi:tyrosine-protein phosphatase YwqE
MLIEMSYLAPSQNANEIIFELQLKGLTPILAHPERYNFYHKEFDKYENFKDRGVMMQVNLLSLAGYYGKEIKHIAERLIKEKLVDFIGTDMHHATHLQATKDFVSTQAFYDLVKDIPLLNKSLL